MSISPKTITLTAAACDGGIRIYTKTPDGIVREICSDTTQQQLAEAVAKNQTNVFSYARPKDWFAGELAFQAGPDSALCAIAWPRVGTAWKISIFYQDADGCIREKYHKGGDWEDPEFEQPNCYTGTNIAAVHNQSGTRVMLFYQGADTFIYSRLRLNQEWKNPVKVSIIEANPGTGIAATVSDDWKQIHVFYQNKEHQLCTYELVFEKEIEKELTNMAWAPDTIPHFKKYYKQLIGDITAISWYEKNDKQVRVYIQDNEDKVQEHVYSNGNWVSGTFAKEVLHNADICAVARPISGIETPSVTVLWAGQDKHLYECTNVNKEWRNVVQVAALMQLGTYAGSWIGVSFTDNIPEADTKVITTIDVHVAHQRIAGIRINYKDGTNTGIHGHKGSDIKTFHLNGGDVTQVWYHHDGKRVLGLKFGTNKFEEDKNRKKQARVSPWYGTPIKGTAVWSEYGKALVGFEGVEEKDGEILGLQPVWSSTRIVTADPAKIPEIVEGVKTLTGDLHELLAQYKKLSDELGSYKGKMNKEVKESIAKTTTGIVTMARAIDYLFDLGRVKPLGVYDRREKDAAEQRNACNEVADQLETQIRSLKSLSDSLRTRGSEECRIHGGVQRLQIKIKECSSKLTYIKDQADALTEVIESKRRDVAAKRSGLLALLPEDFPQLAKAMEAGGVSKVAAGINCNPDTLAEHASVPYRVGDQKDQKAPVQSKEHIEKLCKQAVLTLKARDAEIDRCEKQLKDMASKLAELYSADNSSDQLENDVKGAMDDIKNLCTRDEELCRQVETLSKQFQNIVNKSKALDNHGAAQEYAKHLLEIVKVVQGVERFKSLFEVDSGLLSRTLQDIVKTK